MNNPVMLKKFDPLGWLYRPPSPPDPPLSCILIQDSDVNYFKILKGGRRMVTVHKLFVAQASVKTRVNAVDISSSILTLKIFSCEICALHTWKFVYNDH